MSGKLKQPKSNTREAIEMGLAVALIPGAVFYYATDDTNQALKYAVGGLEVASKLMLYTAAATEVYRAVSG